MKKIKSLTGIAVLLLTLSSCLNSDSHVCNYGSWISDQNYHWKICLECGDRNQKATHTWETVAESTETVKGTKKCTVCSRIEELPLKDHTHSYTSEVIAPTCTTNGYTKHTCTCGANYTDTEVAKLGHDFSNNAQTCLRDGCNELNPNYVVPKFTCSGCCTEYDTETERDNCDKQNGCNKYLSLSYETDALGDYIIVGSDLYKVEQIKNDSNDIVYYYAIYKGYLVLINTNNFGLIHSIYLMGDTSVTAIMYDEVFGSITISTPNHSITYS